MSRHPAWRLDPANYPSRLSIQTRFQDLDLNRHINNAAYATLFEEARSRFNFPPEQARFLKGRRQFVVSVTLDYLAEAYYPQPLDFALGVLKIGTTSWTVGGGAFQRDRCVLLCEATMATVTDAKDPMPAEWRSFLEANRAEAPGSSDPS